MKGELLRLSEAAASLSARGAKFVGLTVNRNVAGGYQAEYSMWLQGRLQFLYTKAMKNNLPSLAFAFPGAGLAELEASENLGISFTDYSDMLDGGGQQ